MAHKGLLTKGAKFNFGHFTTPGNPESGNPTTFTEIANVLKMPSLGGDVEKVEVTTLADAAHQYIPGLIEYGDLEFQLLFDNETGTSNYRVVKSLADECVRVQVELGDKPLSGTHGTQFEFNAILTASLDEMEPGQAMTFTVKCALQSDIEATADPA